MEKNQAVCRIYLQNLRDKTPPRGKNSGSLRLWRPLTHSPQWGSPMLLGCSSHLEIKIRGQVTPGSKTPHLLVEELPSSKPGYHSEILSSCGAQIKGPYFSFSKCPDRSNFKHLFFRTSPISQSTLFSFPLHPLPISIWLPIDLRKSMRARKVYFDCHSICSSQYTLSILKIIEWMYLICSLSPNKLYIDYNSI